MLRNRERKTGGEMAESLRWLRLYKKWQICQKFYQFFAQGLGGSSAISDLIFAHIKEMQGKL
jgi:hypothetical protein